MRGVGRAERVRGQIGFRRGYLVFEDGMEWEGLEGVGS